MTINIMKAHYQELGEHGHLFQIKSFQTKLTSFILHDVLEKNISDERNMSTSMQNLNFSQSFTTPGIPYIWCLLNTTGTVLELPLRSFLYITDAYCALLYLVILHYGTLLMSSIDYCALRYITIDNCRFL